MDADPDQLHVIGRFGIVTCNKGWRRSSMASRLDVAARVQKHRTTLRAAGLRPVQIWVPDSRRADFAAECRRQCLLVRKSRAESGTLKWLAKVADTEGWK
jgi:Protein  of unknown function (DUF3018)